MDIETRIKFVSLCETMVLPEQVAKVNQASKLLSSLPRFMQNYLVRKGSKQNPYMGFVVEPWCFFLSFEITDTAAAEAILPPGYRLVPVSMFEGDTPRLAAILGAFNIHTSVFWGSRMELYLIAENTATGMMSWIIAEYESNTNSYDPGRGFVGPSTERCVVTTTWRQEVLVDLKSKISGKELRLMADLKGASPSALDQRLWVEGNLSVDYGGGLDAGEAKPFGLIFDPEEMSSALRVPLGNVRVERNQFGAGWLASRPFEAACFPMAQHFITTSMPREIGLRNREDLENAVRRFTDAQAHQMPGTMRQRTLRQ